VKLNPRDGSSGQEQPSVLYGVLVTFRRPETFRGTLRALTLQTRPLDHLFVVDNEPVDANVEAVEEYREAGLLASYLPMDENVGPAGGYAAGIAAALEQTDGQRSWIVLVDDDDPPRSDSILEEMERFANEMAEHDPRTGAVGCGGARFNLRTGRAERLHDGELSGPVRVHSIGNNMWPFYDPGALAAAGSFDPQLFFGFEELDVGLRLGRAGYHLYCNGPLRLDSRHRSGRLGVAVRPRWRGSRLAWRRYYSIRNLIWILRRNGSTRGAAWLTLTAGIGKPLVGVLTRVPDGRQQARFTFKACRDGWTGRLGRRVEPPQVYEAKVAAHP
jgi:glycosyltransferase involved in cell wall biosynthesis